jgi:hypothetical protein
MENNKSKMQEEKMKRENPFAEKKEDVELTPQEVFKNKLKDNHKGCVCPTCGRKAKEYKRRLTSNLCLALIEVLKHYRHSEKEVDLLDYFHVEDIFKNNPRLKIDFPKLQYWDLIEAKGKMVGGKFVKNYGYYRISENGLKFAQREVAVPVFAIVYNNVVQGHQLNPYATIDQLLSEDQIDYEVVINPKNTIRYE